MSSAIINRPAPSIPPFNPRGHILGVKLLEGEDFELDASGTYANNESITWYGYQAMLSVESYLPKVQSTIFYGQTLYMLTHSVGIYDKPSGFLRFMDQYIHKRPRIWGELSEIPIPPQFNRINLFPPLPPSEPPIVEAKLRVWGAGYDSEKGYWIEFKGNYWLEMPLFQPAIGNDYMNVNGRRNKAVGPSVLMGAPPGSFQDPENYRYNNLITPPNPQNIVQGEDGSFLLDESGNPI